jgi:hypothetical protein
LLGVDALLRQRGAGAGGVHSFRGAPHLPRSLADGLHGLQLQTGDALCGLTTFDVGAREAGERRVEVNIAGYAGDGQSQTSVLLPAGSNASGRISRRLGSLDTMTDRSMKFSSSLTFPGHFQATSARIVSDGIFGNRFHLRPSVR